MKKLMSLVLVLALCLTAVAAFAEAAPSKVVGTVATTTAGITIVPATAEEIAAAADEVKELVKEGPAAYFGIDLTEVDEFAPINAEVGKDAVIDADGNVEVIFSVDFNFATYENVKVLLGDGTAWTAYDGVASGNLVTAKVNAEVLANAKFFAVGK